MTTPTDSADRYIRIDQAATLVDVHERTIRRHIAAGDLPGFRLGRKAIRVRESDVLALLRPIPTASAS